MKDQSTYGNCFWASVITAILLAGCAGTSPSVTFYTLNAVYEMKTDSVEHTPGENIVIGIGPAVLPGYLDRPQIVTRQGENQLQISEFHRWGNALRNDFLRILAQNVSALLSTPRVIVHPWPDDYSPDYQIRLDVGRFEGQFGQAVCLNAKWSVIGREGKELVARTSTIEEPLSTKDHDGLVAAMSRAVATLGLEIIKEIQRLEATTRTP